jgi:hypothetical protein
MLKCLYSLERGIEEGTMGENRDELLNEYRRTRDELLAVLEGLTDEQMSDPSLDGWSVADHLGHLALWDDLRAAEVGRISAGHDSVWRMSPAQDEAFNSIAYEARRGLSPRQARWELETSRTKLLDALAAATSRGLEPSLYGEAGLRSGHEAQHTMWIKLWRDRQGT